MPPVIAHATDPSPLQVSLLAPTDPAQTSGSNVPSNGSASGLSTYRGNNTTGGEEFPSVPLPTSAPPNVGLFPEIGKTLLDDGIDLHGFIANHFIVNTTAGVQRGEIVNLGIIAPAADFDLDKLAHIPGGTFHVLLSFYTFRHGTPNGIAQYGGFLTGYQATPALSDNFVIVSMAAYEQKLLHDKLSLEVGRMSVFDSFLLPNSLDFFTADSSVLSLDGDYSAAPFPVWGGRATYHFTPTWYTQGGVYEENFYRSTNTPEALGISDNTGVQVIGEVGYRSEFFNADYPANFEAGAGWSTRHGYANIKGSPFGGSSFTTAADYPGGGILFFEGQKVIWRGAKNPFGPPANIAIYGAAAAGVDKPQPIDMDAEAGIAFTGLIPGRPLDALSFQTHYQRLSAVEAAFETQNHNIFAGPGPSQSRNGLAFEVDGNIQATRWLSIRPIVEYFVNPDNYFDSAQPRRPADGFITAILAYIPLGPVFGTSTKPF